MKVYCALIQCLNDIAGGNALQKTDELGNLSKLNILVSQSYYQTRGQKEKPVHQFVLAPTVQLFVPLHLNSPPHIVCSTYSSGLPGSTRSDYN
jgi:hypothetical protein